MFRFSCTGIRWAAAILMLCTSVASAEDFPDRPITLIVPQAPGGGSDIVTRAVAKALSDVLGQPVVVENRSGAGGNIGTVAAARAKPDGYTLVMNSNNYVINPSLYQQAGYDPVDDFVPVGRAATGTILLAVNGDSPAKDLQQFIAQAKQADPPLSYGSPGNGTINHLAIVMFEQAAGIKLEHIPYNGAPAAGTALLGKQVDMAFLAPASSVGFLESGRLRALGVTTDTPVPTLPDVPPISDVVPGYNVTPWYGLFAPKGTPQPIVEKLHEALNTAIGQPALKHSLAGLGIVATPITQAAFAQQVHDEVATWQNIVKAANAKVE